MIDQITENVYISDAASVLYNSNKLHELKITHILTASAMSIPEHKKLKSIKYKFVFIIDMVTQDILAKNLLEDSIKFVEEAIANGGNVLVHCEVGISRSVTIVAGYLMRKFQWTPEKAITFIKQSRPIASPNSSFLKQLEIFFSLGFKADIGTIANSQEYRNFCASTGNMVQYIDLGLGASLSPSTSVDNEQEMTPLADLKNSINPTKRFCCQKCRKELFHNTHLMYHKRGKGTNLDEFNSDNFGGEKVEDEQCMFEYLITPMKWMDLQGSYKGKINCPKCNLTLGKFIWGGRQCDGTNNKECKAHISPWIYIQRRQVDMFNVPKTNPTVNIIEAETTESKSEVIENKTEEEISRST